MKFSLFMLPDDLVLNLDIVDPKSTGEQSVNLHMFVSFLTFSV